MPLYIVRWPNLSAALVRAADEDDLLDKLDQLGNAEGCRIAKYRGPLFIEFELPVDYEVNVPEQHRGPVAPEHITVKAVEGVFDTAHGMTVSAGNCDTGSEMCEQVMRFSFPKVFQEWSKDEERRSAKQLAKAVHDDALEIVRTAWRRGQTEKAGDPASALATAMDMPVRLAKQYLAQGDGDGKPEPVPPASKPRRRPRHD
jgi:hypothetical protein